MGLLAVVAGSLAHANAVIKWEGFDDKLTVPMVYGQDLKSMYQQALLVRPLEGMTPEGREWICSSLLPRIAGDVHSYPPQWSPSHEEAPPAADTGGPALEESPLYA